MEGRGLLARDKTEERLQHLVNWQACATMFITVGKKKKKRCVSRVSVRVAFYILIACPGMKIGTAINTA